MHCHVSRMESQHRCGAVLVFLGDSRSEFVSEGKKYEASDQGGNMACLSSVQEIFNGS